MTIRNRLAIIITVNALLVVQLSGCVAPTPSASAPDGAHQLSGHSLWVKSVAWSPKGDMLASGSFDKSLRIWDVARGTTLHSFASFRGGVSEVVWSPDGKYLVTSSSEPSVPLRVWDTTTWSTVFEVDPALGAPNDASITGIDWSPDSKHFAIALSGTSMKGGPVESWVTRYAVGYWQEAGKLIYRGMGYAKWSPDGSKIAFGAVAPESAGDSFVVIWSVGTSDEHDIEKTKQLEVVSNILTTLTWSPDSKLIAVGSLSNDVYVQDVETGATIQTFKGHTMTVESVDWSPDGRFIASGGSDTTVRVWDASSGQTLVTLDYPDVVHSVAWSPDGKSIAIGCADSNVYLQEEKLRVRQIISSTDWELRGRIV